MQRRITDEEIKGATVPDNTLLVVTDKNGASRELTFSALMAERVSEFNSTDYMLLCAALVYYGYYSAGSHFGWSAKVKAGALQPDN